MRYAYAAFLMRGDSYLPGALVLAYALKLQTNYDCVCLVTSDISPNARRALRLLYNKVIPIDELRFNGAVKEGRSDRNILMTRFQALRLGEGGGLGEKYDKIILLDADVLPLNGYDGLFALGTPAGVMYEPPLPHGKRIPRELTDRVRDNERDMGVNSGLWVLSPSAEDYNAVLAALRDTETMALIRRFPWPEMQLATLLWSGRWTNVDARYCLLGGSSRSEEPYGLHLAGMKPWRLKNRSLTHYARFPDFRLWYQMYAAMYWNCPELREIAVLRRLWEFCRGK